jgi:hypothetical protein
MSVNLYTFVGLFSRTLSTAEHLLAKGAAHATAQGLDPESILDWRLIDDMHPMRFQLNIVCNFARQWVARVADQPVPADVDGNLDLAGYKAAFAEARAYLAAITPEQFGGREVVTVTYEQVERKAEQGAAPIWYYYFTHNVPGRGGKLHAPHTGEIPYVFDSLAHSEPMVGPITPREQQVADLMSTAWATFARTGNPNNPKLPNWPTFDTRRRATMMIDNQCKVVDDPLGPTRTAIAALQARAPRAAAG